MMKRGREDMESIANMAKCLMLLSQGSETEYINTRSPSRVFECKTCNRKFSSFQALGGHRASHKKPRLMGGDGNQQGDNQMAQLKNKTHECSICGLEFSIGQALGGHMRRHRASMNEERLSSSSTTTSNTVVSRVPVLKRSNSRRVFCPDLNLTPLENIDLEFKIGSGYPAEKKINTPMIHCFI